MTVEELSLKHHMERLHGICFPQTKGVDKGGGGGDHICGVLPQGVEFGKYPVKGFPAVAHNAGRLGEVFMYQQLWSQVAVAVAVVK